MFKIDLIEQRVAHRPAALTSVCMNAHSSASAKSSVVMATVGTDQRAVKFVLPTSDGAECNVTLAFKVSVCAALDPKAEQLLVGFDNGVAALITFSNGNFFQKKKKNHKNAN